MTKPHKLAPFMFDAYHFVCTQTSCSILTMPHFEEGGAYCFARDSWSICWLPTTCAIYYRGMLNQMDFKLGTMIHIKMYMIPITLQFSGSRSLSILLRKAALMFHKLVTQKLQKTCFLEIPINSLPIAVLNDVTNNTTQRPMEIFPSKPQTRVSQMMHRARFIVGICVRAITLLFPF